jgi:hypothetical protein
MADADMAERVEDALVRENPVGDDEIGDGAVEIGHVLSLAAFVPSRHNARAGGTGEENARRQG